MGPEPEGDDDWTKYADTGYESSYDPWADMVAAEETEEDDFDDDFEDYEEDQISIREIPRCPAPAGIEHAIRIGTCDHCLGRIAGVRIAGDPLDTVGERVRNQALERDPDLKVNDDVECCPFCEDLFLDLDLISNRIANAIDGIECSRVQLGVHFAKDRSLPKKPFVPLSLLPAAVP